jgi:hypothetical protein
MRVSKLVTEDAVMNPATGRPLKGRVANRKPVAERYPNLSPERIEALRETRRANMRKAHEAQRAAFADPKRRASFTRAGIPDGWTRKTLQEHQALNAERSQVFVRQATEGEDIDHRVQIAMEYVSSVVLNEAASHTDRLMAAKILLDFTKARPKASTGVVVETAESLLALAGLVDGVAQPDA